MHIGLQPMMLAGTVFSVLRLRLAPRFLSLRVSLQLFPLVRNIIGGFCHVLCGSVALFLALMMFFTPNASPQINRAPRPNAPPVNSYDLDAVTIESDGPLRKLRGAARIETTEMVLYADEVDYNADTNYA